MLTYVGGEGDPKIPQICLRNIWIILYCLYVLLGIYNFDKTFKYVDKHEENETGIGIA